MNASRLSVQSISGTLAVLCGLSLTAEAQGILPPTYLAETAIQQMPSDVEVTPNGLVGIVRASEAAPPQAQPHGITAWDMLTGLQIAVSGVPAALWAGENQGFLLRTDPASTPGSALHFSDLVQATDSRAVAIGSQRPGPGLPEDTTFVDFVKIDYPITIPQPPPVVTFINHWSLTDPTPGLPNAFRRKAGHAHDVAVTPNGAIAVVSHRNWVHFFAMSNGRMIGSDNVGSDQVPAGGRVYGPCSPDLAVDSVEVTNTRAVVIMTKVEDVANPTPGTARIMVAYVYDLTVNPVARLASLFIDNQDPTVDVVAHDLAIPNNDDEDKAVVTGNGVAALLKLSTPCAILGTHADASEQRNYRFHADSVEVSGTRAVVTSTRTYVITPPPPPLFWGWRVEVFDLVSFGSLAQYNDNSANLSNEPHDLTITPNGQLALVRTSSQLLCISNLAAPLPNSLSIIGLSSSPALGFGSFVSDSLVATNSIAVTIGTLQTTGPVTKKGAVDFINLTAAPPVWVASQLITNGGGSTTRACDLGFTPDTTRVVVRCADTSVGGPQTGGNDYSIFWCSGSIGTLIGQFSATGDAFGVDSLKIGTTSFIGISELRLPSTPMWNNGDGTVQVIRL